MTLSMVALYSINDKKYLININILYISFKQRSVINLNKHKIDEITPLYTFYHKKFLLYRKSYNKLKKPNMFCNLSSTCLIVAGTIAGGGGRVTMNPIILGNIPGNG